MQLHELQQQIVSNNLDKLYMFTGPEVGIMDIYLEQICKAGEYQLNRVDSVHKAYSRMVQRRMSSNSRCFIVRDDKEYLKDEKVWDKVEQASKDSADMLILIYTEVDKRSKYWKTNQSKMVMFDSLPTSMLANYVLKDIEMTHKLATNLAEICNNDYSRLMLEVDKIKQYHKATGTTIDNSYMDLIEQGVIYQPIGDITFKFTDAIATRDYVNTAKYLLQAKIVKEPEIMVLSILYNTFKQILMVQGLGRDQSNAVDRTGLTSWQVNMAKQKQGHYTIPELVKALKLIRFIEVGIKTGRIETECSLEYLIVNIL